MQLRISELQVPVHACPDCSDGFSTEDVESIQWRDYGMGTGLLASGKVALSGNL